MSAKLNPDLLIIVDENPSDAAKARAWRKLRKHYPIEIAAAEYNKLFPAAIKNAHNIQRNRAGTDSFTKDPEYRKAMKLFRRFHGKDPESIFEVNVPQLPKSDRDLFFVALGGAPAESYLADHVVPGSTKAGSLYVHPYESDDDKLPIKAVSNDGKLIMTLPGKHRVSDWIRG